MKHDYSDLTARLRKYSSEHEDDCGIAAEAAGAIFDLLAEREHMQAVIDNLTKSAGKLELISSLKAIDLSPGKAIVVTYDPDKATVSEANNLYHYVRSTIRDDHVILMYPDYGDINSYDKAALEEMARKFSAAVRLM